LEKYIHNTQQELQKPNTDMDCDIEHKWSKIRTAVVNSAKNCLGLLKKEKRIV